jgi:hypothetical protein
MSPAQIKIAIYVAIGLVIVLIISYVRRFVLNIKGGIDSVQDTVINTTIDNQLSSQTGISPARITELRNVARDISLELETNKDMGYWDKLNNIVLWSDAKPILERVRSGQEMQLIATFYSNSFTNGNSLYTDLNKEFRASQLAEINYLTAIA